MMERTVTVISVEQDFDAEKRDGSTYKATMLNYQDGQFAKQKAFANAFLAKAQPLADKLHALNSGDTITLVTEKNGMFTNVVDIINGATEEGTTFKKKSPVHTPFKKGNSFQDNSIGLQVGNALTNAATLMAHGKAKGSLEEVAEMVLRTGENLKKRLSNGEFAADSADKSDVSKPQTEDVVVDEDINFGS